MKKASRDPKDLSALIQNSESGDPEALNALANEVYPVLKRIAKGIIGKAGGPVTINPTALVNEVFVKFFLENKAVHSNDRVHFYAMMAKAMRWVLLERARSKRAQKRGNFAVHLTVNDDNGANLPDMVDMIELDNLLNELGKENPRVLEVVQLRVFCGLTLEEAAESCKISLATAKRDWKVAQAWLTRKLKKDQAA